MENPEERQPDSPLPVDRMIEDAPEGDTPSASSMARSISHKTVHRVTPYPRSTSANHPSGSRSRGGGSAIPTPSDLLKEQIGAALFFLSDQITESKDHAHIAVADLKKEDQILYHELGMVHGRLARG